LLWFVIRRADLRFFHLEEAGIPACRMRAIALNKQGRAGARSDTLAGSNRLNSDKFIPV
jgi:hypothetical protein